jgi:hypothetical protein
MVPFVRRWRLLGVAGVGVALAAAAGCQTNVGGMTLPSARYLEHAPQYFPADPDFPLQKELAKQEAYARAGAPAAAVPLNVQPIAPPAPLPGAVPGMVPPPPMPAPNGR